MVTTESKSATRAMAGQREQKLLNAFFVLYKTARIVEESNATFKKQAGNFHQRLMEIAEETDPVHIKSISGRYFVNHKMVRYDDQGASGAATVVAEWETLGIGGVHIGYCYEIGARIAMDKGDGEFKNMIITYERQ